MCLFPMEHLLTKDTHREIVRVVDPFFFKKPKHVWVTIFGIRNCGYLSKIMEVNKYIMIFFFSFSLKYDYKKDM